MIVYNDFNFLLMNRWYVFKCWNKILSNNFDADLNFSVIANDIKNKYNFIIYFDFGKTFDIVSHICLIVKMEYFLFLKKSLIFKDIF